MITGTSARQGLLNGAAIGLVLGCAFVVQWGLGKLASHAEMEQGAYSWGVEEWKHVHCREDWVDRGRGRTLLCGPSDSRESLVPGIFDAILRTDSYQAAHSLETLESFLLFLSYVETAYGPSAIPDRVILGVQPRFLMDLPAVDETPMFQSLVRYAPDWEPRLGPSGAELVRKPSTSAWGARYRWWVGQGRRFRSGLLSFGLTYLSPFLGESRHLETVRRFLRPYKYHHLRPHAAGIRSPEPFAFDLTPLREQALRRNLSRLLDWVERNQVDLWIFFQPTPKSDPRLFPESLYDHLKHILTECLPEVPTFDAHEILEFEHFYDAVHPNREGAEILSRAVAEFVKSEEGRNR